MLPYKPGSLMSEQLRGQLCRDHEYEAPSPRASAPQRGPTHSLEDLDCKLVPLKSSPAGDHNTPPSQELCLPALDRNHPQSAASSPFSPPSLYAQSGRGQAAWPLSCGSSLSFGASFPGTRMGLSNLGALHSHSFPSSASPALSYLRAPQATGQRTRWSHPHHDPQRARPV